ncbi:MAG: hypothetical protein CM15mP120_12640 [Pseudomonadota bacterium]|nr:MAG: hypothetical protein CM15mP120_12640 [Pseudomonadota bacterium]
MPVENAASAALWCSIPGANANSEKELAEAFAGVQGGLGASTTSALSAIQDEAELNNVGGEKKVLKAANLWEKPLA